MNSIVEDFKNVFKNRENTLMQMIVINISIFVLLNVLRIILAVFLSIDNVVVNQIELQLSMPANFEDFIFRPWSIITYAFMHDGFFHILFNMLALYWFGKLIQEYLGNKRVISLYVLGSLVGAVFFILIYNLLPFYSTRLDNVMVGSSAGIFAIMVAAATLLPNYTFFLFLFGPVKIKYIVAIYILLSFIGLDGNNAGGNLAHLGGAMIGYIFISQLHRGRDIGKWVTNITDGFVAIFKRKRKMKVTYSQKSKVTANTSSFKEKSNTAQSNSKISAPDQDEIDAILDKISASGYESLTKEEKQKLFNASQK